MKRPEYNVLPVHYGYAFAPNAEQAATENAATYEALQSVCKFGTAPDGTHTVIERTGSGYARATFRIIDNPHQIDAAHLAIFCDAGSLCFGYSASGDRIDVYTD